jgi:hypothetical protein
MDIPKVLTNETFEDYLARWPKDLTNVPVDVIKNWVFYHNEFVREHSDVYCLKNWSFELKYFSSEEIVEIKHYDSEIKHWDHIGNELMKGRMSGYDTADYMLEKGTFPCPIIVAHNAASFKHAKSLEDEFMLEPYHLIEGNRRVGFIRGMHKNAYPKLQPKHNVWVVAIKT